MKDPQDQLTESEKNELETKGIKYATSEKGKFDLEPHDKPHMEMTLHSGDHGEIAKKILKQRIEQRALDFPRWPASTSAGTRVLWIESRFWYDRERLGPDFDSDWREYRAKYLHSLNLDHREPLHVPEYERELLNPIRRFYMRGGDWLEYKIIRPFFTNDRYKSSVIRSTLAKYLMGYLGAIGVYYWLRYNNRTWTANQGPLLYQSQPQVYPDHPKYPFQDYKTEPAHHSDLGFSRRTLFKDLRDYKDRLI